MRWRRLLLSLLPLLSIPLVARPAWCWDPPGHELVGAVADQLLTPDARRHVEQLLGVVGAIDAAIDVLEGRAAPPPFSIRDKKEALLMLAHFVGDLHQPLHAGAIYLDAEGRPVSPERPVVAGVDIRTKGGSAIKIGDKNLHAMWDAVPVGWSLATQPELLALAREVPKTQGPLSSWPEQWASESVRQAASAFSGVSIGPRQDGVWPAKLADPAAYEAGAERTKRRQIARAGARLAAVLNALWP